MVKVSLSFSDPINGLYLVEAIAANGHRWIYGYPDGQMINSEYVRYLTESQCEILANGIRANNGMINENKACWYETDPTYGSEEYQRQGIEMQWATREKTEAGWYGN